MVVWSGTRWESVGHKCVCVKRKERKLKEEKRWSAKREKIDGVKMSVGEWWVGVEHV